MKVDVAHVIDALEKERAAAQRGLPFKVVSTRQQSKLAIFEVEPIREGPFSSALDESLEGARAIWCVHGENRGEVVVVYPERGELVLRFVSGTLPGPDTQTTLYPLDFLSPLIGLWRSERTARRAMSVLGRAGSEPIRAPKKLSAEYSALRIRQADAVALPVNRIGLLEGPPGTGKTFTIGAMIANLLCRFRNSRLLVTGPTNTAVDEALISADDWLQRLGRADLAGHMKRLGSRFDPKRYQDRDHLLAPGIHEASLEITMLELEEPSKQDIEAYVAWKENLEAARTKLKTDVAAVTARSRVVAVTTSFLFQNFDALLEENEPRSRAGAKTAWHFVIADEASQIMLPASLMAASAGACATFAGDPNQLAPIVQSSNEHARTMLEKTAFEAFNSASQVFLNEQSRMCQGICDVVSHTFYNNQLIVCRKAEANPEWQQQRSPWFLDGRELPRVLIDNRGGECKWSQKFNGKIRYESAKLIVAYVHEMLGCYADPADLLILTPFRAHRALLRSMFARDRKKEIHVSTVHRAQGSERQIVLFDPVDAGSPFLNNENGRRLVNVAASRAQAHLVITIGPSDLKNPFIWKIANRAYQYWDTPGKYWQRVRLRIPQFSD